MFINPSTTKYPSHKTAFAPRRLPARLAESKRAGKAGSFFGLAPRRSFSGFTLIELLVVIVIIGILATVTRVALNGSRANARDARRVSDLKQIANTLSSTTPIIMLTPHMLQPTWL